MRALLAVSLLAAIGATYGASECRSCNVGIDCPPKRKAGESCGGECNKHGECSAGLTCVNAPPSASDRFLSFFRGVDASQKPGTCLSVMRVGIERREPCVGCPSEVDVDDQILAAANFGLAALNRQRNSVHALQMVRVVRVTSQVVAGMKYDITLEAGPTGCANDGQERSLSECPVSAGEPLELYRIEVVDAPWRDPRYTLLSHELLGANNGH